MAKRPQPHQLDALRARGFDRSYHVPFTKTFEVRCSQCAALVINNIATHERGCPHDSHECHGCNARIPVNRRYCEECAS
jgi:hypothetical protein